MARKAHNRRDDITCELVAEMYGRGLSSGKIAEELGVNKRLILSRLAEAGVDRRQSNTYNEITAEVLRDLYVNKRMSTRVIAEQFGCSNKLIQKRINKYGILMRLNVDPELTPEERKEKYGHQKESHNLWKGGVTTVSGLIRNRLSYVSKERLQLDGYKCQECGMPNGSMHAHHKRRFSEIIQEILSENTQINLLDENDRLTFVDICESDERLMDVNNLTTLCEKCHHNQHSDEKFEVIPFELLEKEWREYVDANHFTKSVCEMGININVRPYRIIDYMKHKGLPFAYENKEWLSVELQKTSCANIARMFNSLRHKSRAADVRKYAFEFGLIDYEIHPRDEKASSL